MEVMFNIGGLIAFEIIVQRRRTTSPSQAAPRLWNLSRFGIMQPAVANDANPSAPSDLFAQAVCDNSNLEMDWLWLATQVAHDAERRYCLARALYINPHSEAAHQALAALPQPAAPPANVPAFAHSSGM